MIDGTLRHKEGKTLRKILEQHKKPIQCQQYLCFLHFCHKIVNSTTECNLEQIRRR